MTKVNYFKKCKGISLQVLFDDYETGLSFADLSFKYFGDEKSTSAIFNSFKRNDIPSRSKSNAAKERHKDPKKKYRFTKAMKTVQLDFIKIHKQDLWNILLLLDKEAIRFIYKDNNDWGNYCELQHTPLWATGVALRRLYEGNPKGSFHHEGRPYNQKVYPCVFTAKDAWFEEKHLPGVMKL